MATTPVAATSGCPRPPLTGWVTKRKSEGARSRLLCSSNRRYYTVDFDAQVVYYGSAEGSKAVSMPVPFKDILKVEAILSDQVQTSASTTQQERPETLNSLQRSDSKGSICSRGSGLLKRVPSVGSLSRRSPEDQQHGLVLHTAGKTTELFFGSKCDAEAWIEAFKEAISMSGGDEAREEALRQEVSTAPGSSTCTASPSPRSQAEDSAGAEPLPLESERSEESEVQSPTLSPPQRSSRPSSGAGGFAAKAASLFGCSLGALSPPSIAGGSAWGYASNVEDNESSCKAAASRYADKAKGLSLQERLAQLEFSDNEDEDDDDPTAAARKPSARGLAERAAKAKVRMQGMVKASTPQPAVVVETCQEFVPEVNSDSD